jgi:hypothetical protein
VNDTGSENAGSTTPQTPLVAVPDSSTPRPDDDRKYPVWKRAVAGDLPPDARVWVEMGDVTAKAPSEAILTVAKQEAADDKWKEGDEYGVATRLTRLTPQKKVEVTWT